MRRDSYPDPDGYEHEDPDGYEHEGDEDLEELGTPLYQGTGLSVRGLTAEELQRFLDAHAGQPAQLLGRGWDAAAATPPRDAAPMVEVGSSDLVPATPIALPVGPPSGTLGSPGRSALAAARRRRRDELAAWTSSLAWRAPLAGAAGVAVQVLAAQASLPQAGLVGLAAAALVGWRLRFRPSEQVTAWQRGAAGERHTAHLLRRLHRDGFVVLHDLAVPGNTSANVDHLVIGPTGVS
jgi:Nuclease-related domain